MYFFLFVLFFLNVLLVRADGRPALVRARAHLPNTLYLQGHQQTKLIP